MNIKTQTDFFFTCPGFGVKTRNGAKMTEQKDIHHVIFNSFEMQILVFGPKIKLLA